MDRMIRAGVPVRPTPSPLYAFGPALLLALVTFVASGCTREVQAQPTPAAPIRHAAETAPASAPPRTVQFKFPTQTLSVPEGFTVELVAGPPLVNRPISIAFDDRGRLYATDSSGLSERADKQFELKPHRIVRLQDTQGDGRFDRATTFAENMMFPQGALFYDGSFYVAAPPQILKLTDTNDDGVSDRREVWWDGRTLTGCANDVHGPYLGPDGRIYWTKGAFAEQQHTLGNGQAFVSRAAHIFRATPDGREFEPVLTGGMDNPVGVTFTATGERILSGTFFQIGVAGKRDGLIHSVYGGVYGKENAATTGHPRTGDLMPIMTHMGAAAPCGSTTYWSAVFGPAYTGNAFVCYFNLRKVVRHQFRPDGATFTTQDIDFVTSDSQDFRPTDVLEDADGSLLVVDTGGWYKVCCPTSQLAKPDILGAIYRIRKTGASSPADPRGQKLAWESLAADELVKLLGDVRPYVQQRALFRLGQVGEAALAPLAATVAGSKTVLLRRNAIWALARIDRPASRAAVRAALTDADESVAHAALQVCSLWRDTAAAPLLIKLLASDRPALARMAAEALGRMGDAAAVVPLLAAASRLPESATTLTGAPEPAAARIQEHSLIYALIEIGRAAEVRAQLTSSAHPRLVRAALVALDQMPGEGLNAADVIRWLDASDARLKQTAGWIVSHRPEWGGELAGFFRRQLAAPSPDQGAALALQDQLAQLGKSTAIQEVLAETATNAAAAPAARLLALRAMAGSGLKDTPAGWMAALTQVLQTDDPALLAQAVATTRVLPLPKTAPLSLSTALVRVGRKPDIASDVRLDALATAAPTALAPVPADLFQFLCAHLAAQEPMPVRSAAATVLAKAPLSPEQQLALAEHLRRVGALEMPKLLPAFEKHPTEALGLKLVAALKGAPGLGGVRPGALRALLAKYPAAVRPPGDDLLATLDAGVGAQNAEVDALLPAVKTGDIRRGQEVFTSAKTACTMCHVIGYGGGRLGPDLTHIGQIRNERELLEAIMFPSATFVRGYEPLLVTTRTGDTHSGIVRKDAPDEVVLATGPETEQHIARAEIAEIKPGTFSPMPPGLGAVLSRQELADLVAFLKSRN
jgi:putative membrane-bound dehydrogenase-like protein